jgi:S1-C subfamily serine protease
VSAASEDLEALEERATRAVGGDINRLNTLFTGWRRIVGPRPDQLGALARAAYDAIRAGEEPTAEQRQALERAIRVLRPVPPVQGGALDILDAESAPAFPDWDAFRSAVRPFLGAVGRIDRAATGFGHDRIPVATGFLIAEGRLVTNDHVVDELTIGTGALVRGQAEVNFGQELGPFGGPAPAPVESILDRDPELDLAVLAVAPRAKVTPLMPSAHQDIAVGTPVAAIGYPMNADRLDGKMIAGLFGGRLGVKRASPGEVVARRPAVLSHDCTTLGGSSGSPIVALSSAVLIGVHLDGMFLSRNHATCGPQMLKFLSRHIS